MNIIIFEILKKIEVKQDDKMLKKIAKCNKNITKNSINSFNIIMLNYMIRFHLPITN